jgi:hypothetical protein
MDGQLSGLRVEVVAKDDVPASPLAFLAGGDLLVTGAVGDDLALELSERQQNVQRQATERDVRIELLSNGD